jgi:ribonuclease P protein component
LLYLQSKQFQKFELLSAKRSVAFLFEQGQSFVNHPLKVVWKIVEEPQFPVTVLFSVPKKNFPVSPHRNRIKRLLREAYRLNKSSSVITASQKNINIQVAFIYLGKEMPTLEVIEQKILLSLKKIQHELETRA